MTISDRLKAVRFLACVATAGSGLACQTPLCEPTADPKAHYRAEIVERYDETSRFRFVGSFAGDPSSTGTCAGADGAQAGAVFEFQAVGESGNRVANCWIVQADIVTAPAPTVINGPSSNTLRETGTEFLDALAEVTVGASSGTLLIELFGSGDIYSLPPDGQVPNVIMYRGFFPGDGTGICDDNFVIKLSKL